MTPTRNSTRPRRRNARPLAICSPLVTGLAALLAGCAGGEYDVLLLGGLVLDGTGASAVVADVAIRGDRVAAVGDLSGRDAQRVIDVSGLFVAPGFIDVHSHAGAGLATPERSPARALLAQGITTAVINPDGGGPVDLARQRERLEEDGLGVNVIQLVPHGSVRLEAMGGAFDRDPTPEEMEAMLGMARAGMEAGGFGLSTGLFYTPGAFAGTGEVIELARVVAGYDGVHSSHIRDESDYSVGVVAAVEEIIRISRESGVAGIVSHVKALGPRTWGRSREIVARIQAAREEGVEVWADQYPYDASATSLVAALVPAWAREGGDDALRSRLDDASAVDRIREGVRENLERRGGADRILFRGPPDLAGTTLADLAAAEGRDPVESTLGLVRDGRAGGIISFNMSEEDIERLMRQPWTLTSTDGELPVFGEGSPHPRGYGAFPRKIRRYVVEREVLDLPAAVRSMTGAAAQAFRLPDRGVLRAGMHADIVVFDLDEVEDVADYLDPHRYARGMVHVFVNGRPAIEDGEFTETLAGRVLRRHGEP